MAQHHGSGAATRRPLVSGNWKMHHDHLQSIRTVQDLGLRLGAADVASLDVSVHPPFTDLRSVQTVIEDRGIPVSLGAQHCYHEDQGAFTGEVAPPMLARLGVSFVIVGHSERTAVLRPDRRGRGATLRAVLRHAMTPIVCVGETEEEREDGETEARLTRPDHRRAQGPSGRAGGRARGGLRAHLGHRHGAHRHRRGRPGGVCPHPGRGGGAGRGRGRPPRVRIQYGGSVRPENAAELVGQPDVDGALVGGPASTPPPSPPS